MERASVSPDLPNLIGLFSPDTQALGAFRERSAAELPPAYRRLLAHDCHMTVTVEAHFRSPVDVQVLSRQISPAHYAREIVLTRRSDGAVVQFGVVRVRTACLPPGARRRIEDEGTPLGRVLLDEGVLTRVRLSQLWEVAAGGRLAWALRLAAPATTYGRTAVIELDGEPAIELLEILAPLAE